MPGDAALVHLLTGTVQNLRSHQSSSLRFGHVRIHQARRSARASRPFLTDLAQVDLEQQRLKERVEIVQLAGKFTSKRVHLDTQFLAPASAKHLTHRRPARLACDNLAVMLRVLALKAKHNRSSSGIYHYSDFPSALAMQRACEQRLPRNCTRKPRISHLASRPDIE